MTITLGFAPHAVIPQTGDPQGPHLLRLSQAPFRCFKFVNVYAPLRLLMPRISDGRPQLRHRMGAKVGLTAQDLGSMARLSQLAANPQGARAGTSISPSPPSIAARHRACPSANAPLMREILQRLAGDVEMAIRIALAERLADDDDSAARS